MGKADRRDFIKKLGVAVTGAAGVAGPLNVWGASMDREEGLKNPRGTRLEWDLITTWPAHFPILGEGVDLFSQWVGEMSNGRLKINVHGGGEQVPPLGVFDAVSTGEVQMGHGASYYWAAKCPASQFFTGIPFGFNAQIMNTWLYSGGGMELWREVYREFNLVPFVAGNTGVQMGGWFNRRIESMADFRGLRMRIPGVGAKVLTRAGGRAVLVSGEDLCSHMAKGWVDATEWIGPFHDMEMGLHRVASYYYHPGWHENGSALELILNRDAWEQLPGDLQSIVEAAAVRLNLWMLSEFEARNTAALAELVHVHGVKLRQFPIPVLKKLKRISGQVLEELANEDPQGRRVYDALTAFGEDARVWNRLSEGGYQGLKYL